MTTKSVSAKCPHFFIFKKEMDSTAPGISIPHELVQQFLLFLPIKDIYSCMKVSRLWYWNANANSLWFSLIKRDFGIKEIKLDENLKKRYQDLLQGDFFLQRFAEKKHQERLLEVKRLNVVPMPGGLVMGSNATSLAFFDFETLQVKELACEDGANQLRVVGKKNNKEIFLEDREDKQLKIYHLENQTCSSQISLPLTKSKRSNSFLPIYIREIIQSENASVYYVRDSKNQIWKVDLEVKKWTQKDEECVYDYCILNEDGSFITMEGGHFQIEFLGKNKRSNYYLAEFADIHSGKAISIQQIEDRFYILNSHGIVRCYDFSVSESPQYVLKNKTFVSMKVISSQKALLVTFENNIELWDLENNQCESSIPIPKDAIFCHLDLKWGKIFFFEKGLASSNLHYYDFHLKK